MASKSITIEIEGLNYPLIHYPLNWAKEPEQSFEFDTAIYRSTLRREQRSTTLQQGELRHLLKVNYLGNGRRESRLIYNRLFGVRGKSCVIPWLTEPLEDSTDRQGSSLVVPTNMFVSDIKVLTDQIVRVSRSNKSLVENRVVSSVDMDANEITVEYDWDLSIPSFDQVFFFCRGAVMVEMSRGHLTDQTNEIEVLWRSHDDGLLP